MKNAKKHAPGHVATAADRAKDPYLSADSIVYETKQTEPAKHTPLPWRSELEYLSAERKARTYYTNIFSGNTFVAKVHDNDAPLIVRACNSHDDLLTALQALVPYAEQEAESLAELAKDDPETEAEHIKAAKALELARAAIAKAERGEG